MFIRMIMAHKFLFSIAALMLSAMPDAGAQAIPDYKNPSLSPQERTADLLSRMTIEEKIGQTLCPLGWPMYEKHADGSTSVSQKFQDFITLQHGGMLWATFRADPWTQKTLETGLNPELAAETYNKLQEYAISHSRLGIPVILAEEAPHGHMAIGTTVFPTSIGLAATWDTAIMEKTGRTIAEELRSQGGHIGYGPVIDLAREPRWSRVEETYGEDVCLTSQMASAMIRGTSVKHNGTDKGIISTLKHFIAYGIPEGGHNGNPSFIGQRDLHENFLPAFKAAVDAGALSIMTSYNAIDGVPSTANASLVRGIIHDEWDFGGFVVSDLESIDGLCTAHHIAADKQQAGELAMKAGVDVDLGANCYSLLAESFRSGKLDTGLLDEAAGRVLRLKFELGLFDDPYIDPAGARKEVRTAEHIRTAREAAAEGIVLLENNGILPLKEGTKIAVIGPNADNMYNQLGDTGAEKYFGQRSRSYTYYFDPQTQFMRGRASDGSFRTPFDPFKAPHMRSDYTEGNAWQYTWLVPHDVHGLIGLFGGEKPFLEKLEGLFRAEGDLGGDANDVTGLIGQYAHGNEPSHHIAYMFNYAGRQDRCAEIVRTVTDSLYFDDHSGVCGNEDAGQMSAWYIMSSIGLYQVDPAGGRFVIGSPSVKEAVLDVGGGRKFTVSAPGNSRENIYVTAVRLNGKPHTRSWITYSDIVAGGTLEFDMGPEPSGFGSGAGDRP